jgi:hypothetical protein
MTLRADITSAFDEIAPPAPELQGQLRMLIAAEANATSQSRRRRGPWMVGLRGTMALVAALLVVLIVATLLVGGRVWHGWGVPSQPAPAGQIDPVQLAALEARSLIMPVVPRYGECPVGPNISTSAAAALPEPMHSWALAGFQFSGDGPGYATVSAARGGYETAWGSYTPVEWVIDARVSGLVLIRGRDAANHDLALAYVGQYAAGPVIGTDTVNGKPVVQHSELVFDASHHPATSGKSTWGVYEVLAGIPTTMTGCHVFQVDGEGFSEVFYTNPG